MNSIGNKWLKLTAATLVGVSIVIASITGFMLITGGTEKVETINVPNLKQNVSKADEPKLIKLQVKTLKLNKKNTVIFRGAVTEESVAKAQKELLEKSSKLSKNDSIYLYLDSPGGNIIAGEQLIDTIKGLPQKVHTITQFSASMAFVIVQSLNDRYILPSGELMSHRAKLGGVGGQIPGELLTRINSIYDAIRAIEVRSAVRMEMSHKDYEALIKDEYWVRGGKAVVEKAADAVVTISCDQTLMGTNSMDIQTLFGNIQVTFSDCPAVTGPVAIDFKGVAKENQNSAFDSAMTTLNPYYGKLK